MPIAEMIELECPGCSELLEIDNGFAGGVCRCSSCGTLMTVPANAAEGEAPERLTRPDRPDAPRKMRPSPARGASPEREEQDLELEQSAGGKQGGQGEDDGNVGSGPNYATQVVLSPEALTGEDAEAAVASTGVLFITASGKTVRIGSQDNIPTAQKKKRPVVRAFTMIIVLAIAASVIGVVMYAASILIDSASDPNLVEVDITRQDLKSSPYHSPPGHFMGIPLRESAVLAIDGSGQSEKWIDLLAPIVRIAAVPRDDAAKKRDIQVVFWSENGPIVMPDQPRPWTEQDIEKFQEEALDLQFKGGTADPKLAFRRALQAKPKQVILVTSQAITGEHIFRLTQTYESHGDTKLRVYAVLISAQAGKQEMATYCKERGGRVVEMPEDKLIEWWRIWDEQQNAPASE